MSQNNSEEKLKHKQLLSIIDEYLVDLECLREMHASVVPFLQEQDRERKDTLSEIFKSADSNREEREEEIEDEIEGAIYDAQNAADKSTSEKPDIGPQKKIKKTITLKFKPEDVDYIRLNSNKIEKAEKLFEKQLVVTLVSRFDEFLGNVLRLALEKNPEWVISSEKTISYKELIALKSVDKAIQGVIYKEVDDLLRDSHDKQIQYIDEKFKTGVKQHFTKLTDFLEITERRNLFVHTGGVVSNQYIEKCKGHGCKIACSVGDPLGSGMDYFNNAFLTFFEIGLRIGQATYRRIFDCDIELADQALNNIAVKFMNLGEYHLSELITDFDIAIPEKLRSAGTEYLYFAKINRAVSQKFQNKDFEKGLLDDPWKVFHPKYALVIHVLRDEFCEAAKLMNSDEIKSSVGKEGFRGWPVFKLFRESEEFKNSYKELFGHEYYPDYKNDSKLKEAQENKALES